MGMTSTRPQAWQRWKASSRMAVLAAFEDSITGTRVKGFCQGLSRELGAKCRIVEHVWLFSTFRLQELQEIAAEEASASDLVIISIHQSESLPDEVKSWIDLWLRPKVRHPAVLLALLDPEGESAPNGVQAYLQEVASRGGIEFLVEAADEE
jgi:hypothetical protein